MNHNSQADLTGLSINKLASLWLKKTLVLTVAAVICATVIGQISPSGAPDPVHIWGYLVLTQLAFGLALLLRLAFKLIGRDIPTRDLIEFAFRLLLGLALFPLICVLFLNRSKL